MYRGGIGTISSVESSRVKIGWIVFWMGSTATAGQSQWGQKRNTQHHTMTRDFWSMHIRMLTIRLMKCSQLKRSDHHIFGLENDRCKQPAPLCSRQMNFKNISNTAALLWPRKFHQERGFQSDSSILHHPIPSLPPFIYFSFFLLYFSPSLHALSFFTCCYFQALLNEQLALRS